MQVKYSLHNVSGEYGTHVKFFPFFCMAEHFHKISLK